MNPNDVKKALSDFAESNGIKKFGFSKNAFVALFPYYIKGEKGNISMYARGTDYHRVAEEKLKPVADKLVSLGADYAEIFADKGGLDDRKAAFDAGLGFFGKNGMLICEEYGSYFFIGQVVHNLDIPADTPQKKSCLNCENCIKLCHGGALLKNGFDITRCVSHISQKKGELSKEEKSLIKKSNMCWGCDKCQQVCPHNLGLETTAIEEFKKNRIASLKKEDIDKLSNKKFKEKYYNYAFSWRGKSPLARNLEILSEETYE